MCYNSSLSISSCSSWVQEPFDFSNEKCRLSILVGAALAAIGIGLLWYFYGGIHQGGIYAACHKEIAYAFWGIGGGIALLATVAYITKRVLSQKKSQKLQSGKEFNETTYSLGNRVNKVGGEGQLNQLQPIDRFAEFFPDRKIDTLPEFTEKNLIGNTGCFDQDEEMEAYFVQHHQNVLYALQGGRQFLGIRLSIQKNSEPKISATLLISKTLEGGCYVHYPQLCFTGYYQNISDNNRLADRVVSWIQSLLKGEESYLFYYIGNGRYEIVDGPIVKLWED